MPIKMFTGLVLIIATQSVYYTNGAQIKSKHNDPIIFPGPIQEVPLTRYGADENDIPEKCRNKNYCTIKPVDYPQERFNSMIKSKSLQQVSLVQSDLDDRQGDPEEIDNCETLVEYDKLYKVKSDDGQWRTVVQAPEKNYVQKVRLETCQGGDQECFEGILLLPGYKTYCKQQYSKWSFMVDTTDGSGNTENITVNLPTCCSCHYKKV
ncbi:unnamed protein product [Diatraea saccharalis]|uniref:Spaetzle domain-containing protein n=1 Tax=Diatraea saccharalis TaxID=40085 RepID=A0A9P0CBD9_9NEOP|nr:unnamed protein product [Diatraea saccharalis]